MSDKIRALLLGDDSGALWHPLTPVREELDAILGENWIVESTEDYDRMAGLNRDSIELFISYTDCWSRDLTPEQISGLIGYVAAGGGLLLLHNGISLHRSYEAAQMIGAKFAGHPPYQPLVYRAAAATAHPVMADFHDFELDEEPYMFEFDPFTPRTVFLEFEFEGKRHPAAWSHSYGLGRVLYLQPGHHAPSFKPEAYRSLIRRCALWAAGRL
jgi:type 1 glutamine amidotransferase